MPDATPHPTPARRRWLPRLLPERTAAERASALKERVYASFTGLAIVSVFALDPGHATADGTFLALLAGITGITIAGLVADIISHLITHSALPTRTELLSAVRIAAGAITSASISLVALAMAWIGIIPLGTALQISVGIYLLTLGLIALIAVHRTGLPPRHRLIALGGLLGLGASVVLVLALAH